MARGRGNRGGPSKRGTGFTPGGRGGRGGQGGRGWGGRGGSFYSGQGRGRGGAPGDLDDDFALDPTDILPSNFRGRPPSVHRHGSGRGSPFNNTTPYNASPYNGSAPNSGRATPSRGNSSPRARGRGFSRDYLGPTDRMRQMMLSKKLRTSTAPLSQLLYEDRPLLRPIVFVRSELTPKLFMEEEEIFKPVADEAGDLEQSHVPTADRVFSVFSHPPPDDEPSRGPSDGEEGLEEIEFEDMAKAVAEVEAIAASKTSKTTTETTKTTTTKTTSIEETFAGFYVDTRPAPAATSSIPVNRVGGNVPLGDDDDEAIVYVAPHPRIGKIASPAEKPAADAMATDMVEHPQEESVPALEPMDMDEFVETAPPADSLPIPIGLPTARSHSAQDISASGSSSTARAEPVEVPQDKPVEAFSEVSQPAAVSPTEPIHASAEIVEAVATSSTTMAVEVPTIPPSPSIADFSFSFAPSPSKPRQIANLPRALRKDKPPRTKQVARRRRDRHAMFGAFGAMMSEARLHERERDPRREEQRRGDSDVDWGDTSGDEVSEGTGGMQVDEELQMDMKGMEMFVRGMEHKRQNQMSMGDVEDEVRMRAEDEESEDRGSESEEDEEDGDEDEADEEVEMVVSEEEKHLIGEGDEDDDGDEDEGEDEDEESDEEETPKHGFQARLERIRQRSEGKPVKNIIKAELDGDENKFSPDFAWGEGEESLAAEAQELLDENKGILEGRNLRDQNRLFHQIYSGDFDEDLEYSTTPAKRGKDKKEGIPRELQDQWERDRVKKADRKRQRAEERLIAAADPFSKKRGGKKGRKAMLAAASLDRRVMVPNRVVDFASLGQQIRRFLENIGGPDTIALPPMAKDKRKMVHELAEAFSLKSQSKGKGEARYTSLIKTTRSGVEVNDRKVRNILKRAGVKVDVQGGAWGDDGKGKGDKGTMRPKEGEIVGKAAPKIGESNVGFQMLAAMGWAEGSRIGVTGGLKAPLTAVVKNTRLGLGASRG